MRTEAFLPTRPLPVDRGGSRAAGSGPPLKRSRSFPLPSVHEESLDELGKARAGDQMPLVPPGKALDTLSLENLWVGKL